MGAIPDSDEAPPRSEMTRWATFGLSTAASRTSIQTIVGAGEQPNGPTVSDWINARYRRQSTGLFPIGDLR
jgi:hypothetical protein